MAYLALSKGGSRVHYPRVATIQGWIWGPLSKGGHYPRVATIQGWPLSKGGSGVHYPRVALSKEAAGRGRREEEGFRELQELE